MFLVTKCVQIQLILLCLVSDLNCWGLDVEAPQEKGKQQQQQKLVRNMKYCTLFYDGCGKLSISSPLLHQFKMYIVSWEVHWLHWDIFYAILFLFSQYSIFLYLLHVYVFVLKPPAGLLACHAFTFVSTCYSSVLFEMPNVSVVLRLAIAITNPRMTTALVTLVRKYFPLNHLWNTKT